MDGRKPPALVDVQRSASTRGGLYNRGYTRGTRQTIWGAG